MKKTRFTKVFTIAIIICLALSNTVFAQQISIKDLDLSSDYAKQSIENLVKLNIITGDENGNFNPHNSVTRGEMVAMLARALNIDTDSLPEVATFRDVPVDHWAFKYVESAYREGIVKGVSKDEFGVTQTSNREQMAAMFVRALGATNITENHFAELANINKLGDKNQVSGWATYEVEVALLTGLMQGTGGNNFSPKAVAKREQVAVVIDRFIKNQDTVTAEVTKVISGDYAKYPELYRALHRALNPFEEGEVKTSLEMFIESELEKDFFRIASSELKRIIGNDFHITGKAVMETREEIIYGEEYEYIIKDGELYIWDAEDEIWIVLDYDYDYDWDSLEGIDDLEDYPSDDLEDLEDYDFDFDFDFDDLEDYNYGNQGLMNYQAILEVYSRLNIQPKGEVTLKDEKVNKYVIEIDEEVASALVDAGYHALVEEAFDNEKNQDFAFVIEVYVDKEGDIARATFSIDGAVEEDEDTITIFLFMEVDYKKMNGQFEIKAPENFEVIKVGF